VLGSGAGPRRRVFGHGRRSSRAHRLLRGRHEASGRSEEILASYVSGSRRDAAEVVAYVASRIIARLVCWPLPAGLPGAFASA
jgi:hypothetical protein